jgi:hypothetical protein
MGGIVSHALIVVLACGCRPAATGEGEENVAVPESLAAAED